MTGEHDYVSDGETVVKLSNGHKYVSVSFYSLGMM
jgi:hydroxyethylthiazole kinase-like sugar kinase family protein